MTHGRLNLVGDVFGWLDIGRTVTEHKSMAGQPQRFQAFNWAMQAARAQGFPVDSYPRQVAVINQDTDWGGLSRGRSMLLPHSPGSPWSHSRAAHEFGHVLGLDDAFRTTAGASGTVDTRYQDWYCIMSYATTGDRYQSTVSGDTSETGPGLGGSIPTVWRAFRRRASTGSQRTAPRKPCNWRRSPMQTRTERCSSTCHRRRRGRSPTGSSFATSPTGIVRSRLPVC